MVPLLHEGIDVHFKNDATYLLRHRLAVAYAITPLTSFLETWFNPTVVEFLDKASRSAFASNEKYPCTFAVER